MTVSLSLGCTEMRQAICLFVSFMAKELHHIQMFTEVVWMVFCSRNFQEKIVNAHFILYLLGQSFNTRLESCLGFAFYLKIKSSP